MYELTEEDREKLSDCRVVASVSGGKDSAALSLWLTEQWIDHLRVFADTGWEHPDTYTYLRGPLTDALGPIFEVQSKLGGLADIARHKGMFPSRLTRYCTTELKLRPIKAYHASLDCEVINAVGIRAAESKARSKMSRWEDSEAFDCETWRPLIDWSVRDVIDIHTRHGLAPNPLYLRGSGVERVGCWPCIFSRKKEIAQVAELTPWRIDEIRQLEAEVTAAAQARSDARGKGPLRGPRTLFHARAERGTPLPIDEVVAWSRTARGGRQLLLLDTDEPGCVRWGLCEGRAPSDDE